MRRYLSFFKKGVILLPCMFPLYASAQVTLLDPAGAGGFEGASFSANGWSTANGSGTVGWYQGALGTSGGTGNTKGAYISNNSGTNARYGQVLFLSIYTYSTQTSHLFRDFTVPAGATNISLSFKWRAGGEASYDYFKVYVAPQTPNPTGSTVWETTMPAAGNQVGGPYQLSGTNFQTVNIPLNNNIAGVPKKLIFSWTNDNADGTASPGAIIDEVRITYTAPCNAPTVPTIVQGTSVNRCAGDPPTTLSITGTLNDATAWQWYSGSCGGAAVGTGTSISVTPSATTTYYVRGTGGCVTGGTCASVTVNVNQPPVITTNPVANTDICSGGTLNLSAAASNATGYRWYFEGGLIPPGSPGVTGESSANLQITGMTPAYTGTYYAVATGNSPCVSAQSNNAVVTVNNPVNIITEPSGMSLCEGAQINLSVNAAYVGSYQWYNQNGAIPNGIDTTGTTSMNLVIDPSVTGNAGSYYAVLTGLAGCANANTATVPVTIAPQINITTQTPTNLGICDGDAINLSVTADNGNGYQWYKDGGQLTGETGSSLTISNSTATDAGDYYVAITGFTPCPDVNSVVTTVTNDLPPAITSQPIDPNSCHGTPGAMTVVATGANLTYQWYQDVNMLTDDAIYTGTDAAALTISDVSGLDNNDYTVVVTGSCGSPVTSDIVTLSENFNNTWTGTVNNDWGNSSNWGCGIVPTSVTNAIIPDVTNDPVIDIPTAACKNLMIDAGAAVTFTGTANQLSVFGDIMNNGAVDGTNGIVELAGSAQSVSGPAIFGDLHVNGGDVKTLGGDVIVNGILDLNSGMIELGANNMYLSQPEMQLGGNPTSYIITNGTGAVIGAGMGAVGGNADSVTFHVGINSTSYTPVALENLGDADSFSVRVMENVYTVGNDVTSPLVTNPVVTRTWMVGENTAGGSIVNMTPMWNSPADPTVDFDPTHVFVAHYWNNEWISYVDSANGAPAAIAGPFAGMWQTTQDSIENFSPFTVASAAQFPLAIRLASITAGNVGLRNKIQWKSETEDVGDIYVLESSTDGRNFIKVAKVPATGKPSTYMQWHETPAMGVNYYRVKLENNDGSYSYSKVVTATVKGKDGFSIDAYPNPVKNLVSVKVDGVVSGTGKVTVTDVTGRVVRSATEVINNGAEINMESLGAGTYLLNYTDDMHNESIKITKQ